MKKILGYIVAAATLGALGFTLTPATAAPVPQAAAQFAPQAQVIVAALPVGYVGADWGPVPIWRVDLRPFANWTIDVAAPDAATARADPFVLGAVELTLWEQAGSPALPTTSTATVPPPTTTTNPMTTTTTPLAPPPVTTTILSTTTTDPIPDPEPSTTTTTTTTPEAPVVVGVPTESVSANFPTGRVFMTRQLSVPLASPLALSIGKALGLPVTFSSTAKFAVHGKPATIAAIRRALRTSHSVTLTLAVVNHRFVVLRLAA